MEPSNVPCFPNGVTNGNGITAFPGSTPLYKSGILVGGLGISGDGVDQDDYVANAGAAGYLPDPSIRADQIEYQRHDASVLQVSATAQFIMIGANANQVARKRGPHEKTNE